MSKRLKSQKGFTLIELMVVIVIIGILVAIALPNFIGAQDRAKLSSVKANMHTYQTIVETYAVDWGGTYGANITEVRNEATGASNPYNKTFVNPFSSTATSIVDQTTDPGNSITATITGGAASAGAVSYRRSTTSAYAVYGGDKIGRVLSDKGRVFFLSNS